MGLWYPLDSLLRIDALSLESSVASDIRGNDMKSKNSLKRRRNGIVRTQKHRQRKEGNGLTPKRKQP